MNFVIVLLQCPQGDYSLHFKNLECSDVITIQTERCPSLNLILVAIFTKLIMCEQKVSLFTHATLC